MASKRKKEVFVELLTILNTLRGIFQQLEDYEKTKREVLIKKQAQELQQILLAQEDLLREVHRLEILVDILFQEMGRMYGQEINRLSDLELLPELPNSLRQKISSLRLELSEMSHSLRIFATGNEKLIKDNIDFFQEIIKSFQENLGYGQSKGGISRPLFVDSTV